MSRRLIVSALPGERRAAWLEHETLVALEIRRDDKPSYLGNLYLGRVTAVDKPLGLAFLDIGLAKAGVLPLSAAGGRQPSEGDALPVAVVRDPEPDKGARLTGKLQDPPADLTERCRRAKAPALLRQADDLLAGLQATAPLPAEIAVDDLALHGEIKARLAEQDLADRVALRLEPEPLRLFEREGLEAEIESLLEPAVPLPSGGGLLIEPVRSLTAIDVNSSRHEVPGGREDLALAVNLEAAAAIARQIVLRALSGLIVVDFLRLEPRKQRDAVVAALRDGLEESEGRHEVGRMSESGLVEISRQRRRPPLHELLTEPCGLGGSGRAADPVSLAYEALRALGRELAGRPWRRAEIEAPPRVIAALEGPVAAALASLAERWHRPIALRPRPAAPSKPFSIMLE